MKILLKTGLLSLKVIGLFFCAVSILLIFSGVRLILDVDAILICNGVETNSIFCKVAYLIFGLTFLAVGAFLLFVNGNYFRKLLKAIGIEILEDKDKDKENRGNRVTKK